MARKSTWSARRRNLYSVSTISYQTQNFFLVCGDRHWQYHAVDPSGLEEFSCGALVDANSRIGRMPGDPDGTNPEGLIKHLHVQTEPSGGFLLISCHPGDGDNGPRLSFEFFDELGSLLYAHHKQ